MGQRTPPGKPAPADLRIVQDLVNSREPELGIDDWADLAGTRTWLGEHGHRLGEEGEAGRLRLVAFREAVRDFLAHNDARVSRQSEEVLLREAERARLTVALQDHEQLRLRSTEDGVDAVISEVLAAIVAAQLTGRWMRLKVCANPDCRYAFYDESKNRSGRWCSGRLCGAMLASRNYRARRRRSA